VVLSGQAGTIEGRALNAKNEAVPNSIVVAVPEEKYRKRQDRFLQTSADQNGHFRLRGASPGNYTIFAPEDFAGDQLYDPEFLKAHEGNGRKVKISEGSREEVTLTTITSTFDATETAQQ